MLDAPRFSDYEAYPVVFLYRQALELYLKHIIYQSALLSAFRFRDDVDGKLRNSHDLGNLFKSIESVLAVLFPDDDALAAVVQATGSVCSDWQTLDPGSYTFRYPVDKRGHPSTKRQQINLRAFANRMSSVLDDLSVIDFGLNVETDRAQATYEDVERLLSSIWDA
jgi:hypothetical protein